MPRPAASASLDEGPEGQPAGSSAPVDVHGLDFRRVGIHTWKVKVKIGLVYDFSDFRTLAKYIGEGRVTATDKVSHDGNTWTDIGSLEALERHFIDTYHRLEREQLAAAAAEAAAVDDDEEDFDDDEPTNIIGMGSGEVPAAAAAVSLASFSSSAAPRILPGGDGGSLAAATAAALQAEAGPDPSPAPAPYSPQPEPEGSPRFVDPFEKRKRDRSGGRRPAARPPSPPPVAADGGSRGAFMGLGAIALVGFAVWFFLLRTPEPAPRPAQPGSSAAQVEPPTTDREKLKQKIMDDLEPVPEPELDEPEVEDDPWGVEAEPELRPVVPEHVRRGQAQPAPTPIQPGARGGQASTAQDHLAAGDSAAGMGDWSTAAMAYRKAVSIDPRNAVYNGKLGIALRRTGDSAGAYAPLSTAASGGYSVALRELGDLSAEQGDTAGALGYYQRYLNSRPRDAAEVQRKIDRLNGG